MPCVEARTEVTDDEVLELIRLLPDSWGNVVKISRVFGVRSWEVAFINRATNKDGEPQLRVTKGKTYNTRGGVKEETEPRWLEAVAIDGSTFGLVEGWEQLKLPPPFPERPSGPCCDVCPLAAADGQIRGKRRVAKAVRPQRHVLRPGSRDREGRHPDRRSHGAHGGGLSPKLPNNRVDEREDWFAQAGGSHAASPRKRQQQIQQQQ